MYSDFYQDKAAFCDIIVDVFEYFDIKIGLNIDSYDHGFSSGIPFGVLSGYRSDDTDQSIKFLADTGLHFQKYFYYSCTEAPDMAIFNSARFSFELHPYIGLKLIIYNIGIYFQSRFL